MSYTIISRRSEETIFTTVQYDIDGQIVEVEVPHFMPGSEQDIVTGIENREITERKKLLEQQNEVI